MSALGTGSDADVQHEHACIRPLAALGWAFGQSQLPPHRPTADRPTTDRRPTDHRPPTDCPSRPADQPTDRPSCPTRRPDRPPDRTCLNYRPTASTVTLAATLEAIAATFVRGPCANVAQNRYASLLRSPARGRPACAVPLLCALCPAVVGAFPSLPPTSLPARPVLIYRYEDGSEEGQCRRLGVVEAAAGEEETLLCRCQTARPTLESAPCAWAGSGALFWKGKEGRITKRGKAGGINETCRCGRMSQRQVCRRVDNNEENKRRRGEELGLVG